METTTTFALKVTVVPLYLSIKYILTTVSGEREGKNAIGNTCGMREGVRNIARRKCNNDVPESRQIAVGSFRIMYTVS